MNIQNNFLRDWGIGVRDWFLKSNTQPLIPIPLMVIVALFISYPAYAIGDDASKIEGFNLEGYGDNGEKAWEVNGDKADVQGTLIKLSNIIAHSYGKDHYKLTAKTGSVDQVQQLIHLKEDVIIRKDDGSRLTTDKLDWDRKADTMTTDERVMISSEDVLITGTGMETHPNMKKGTIEEDVKVRVNASEKTGITDEVIITSDGPMSMDQLKQIAVFEDNVKMIQKDKTVTADRMDVQFSPETKKIISITCIGHVVIVDGDNKSYADRAVYDVQTQKINLFGRPKLILDTKGQDVLTPSGD